MREYFPKSSEISKDVYKQVKAILEGYDRLKQERLNIMYGSGRIWPGCQDATFRVIQQGTRR